MKSLRECEPIIFEFEGRTSDEAIQRARKELGDIAPIRCWRARRGGFFGFFARETYVAGLTPPEDMVRQEKKDKDDSAGSHRLNNDKAVADSDDWANQLLKYAERTTLSDLVEGTTDKVILSMDLIPENVFSSVLSEAEATLNGLNPPGSAVSAQAMGQEYLELSVVPGPERIDGLIDSLAAVGVPSEYQPCGSDATLDGLIRSLRKLPDPRPIPISRGSVIVVVGECHEANAAARQVVATLGLASSEPLAVEPSDSARLQILLRQCGKKVTVIVVDAPLRSRGLTEVASWVEKLKPDYVLGAVSAANKRSDVDRWQRQLGCVDALAVSSLSDTAAPGELLGVLPIAYLDGLPASSLRWVHALIGSILESGR